jgi:hypothetical protein
MADDLLGLGKAADALSKPLQDFLTKLLGPAASEAGELFADRIRYLRWKNTLHILQQSKQELDKRKLTVQNIPLKTLFPILEGASLESDDENLQTKWVNLLVSAASGNSAHPSYPKALSELTSSEAKLLDYLYVSEIELETQEKELELLYDELMPSTNNEQSNINSLKMKEITQSINRINCRFLLEDICKNLLYSQEELFGAIEICLRLNLCKYPEVESKTRVITSASLSGISMINKLKVQNKSITSRIIHTELIRLTKFGKMFMKACQAQSD